MFLIVLMASTPPFWTFRAIKYLLILPSHVTYLYLTHLYFFLLFAFKIPSCSLFVWRAARITEREKGRGLGRETKERLWAFEAKVLSRFWYNLWFINIDCFFAVVVVLSLSYVVLLPHSSRLFSCISPSNRA